MDVRLPKWGVTMQEATLVRWLKAAGDPVEAGEPIADVETDKVEAQVEAPAAGVLVRLVAAEGEIVPVGGVLAELEAGETAG